MRAIERRQGTDMTEAGVLTPLMGSLSGGAVRSNRMTFFLWPRVNFWYSRADVEKTS